MPIIQDEIICSDINRYRNEIGGKALGLCIIPKAWRPPFYVVPASFYDTWVKDSIHDKKIKLEELSQEIISAGEDWLESWPRGIILRSSVRQEGLNDRGRWSSQKMAADYDISSIARNIKNIYDDFAKEGVKSAISIIVQPLVPTKYEGHISNERRVSKTINQWQCEVYAPVNDQHRFNSQRGSPPDSGKILQSGINKSFHSALRNIGRWATKLGRGPSHIEISYDQENIWLLQIDFEDEAPDFGKDPKEIIRPHIFDTDEKFDDLRFLAKYDPDKGKTKWNKLENTKDLRQLNNGAFPELFYITGDVLLKKRTTSELIQQEIQAVTKGRAVCRTDCIDKNYSKLNLPRSPTVNAIDAYELMKKTTAKITSAGVKSSDVCFIIHRFIPSLTAAWVRASPESQVVTVDALWGVPDGLQYLPHDSFQFDIKRDSISADTLDYKPEYIQESEDGSWETIKIRRKLARHRSISTPDIEEIAKATHQLAIKRKKPLMIMWFCDIPPQARIGRNLPWFTMDSHVDGSEKEIDRPKKKKITIRNEDDIQQLISDNDFNVVLELAPELNLYREDERFLKQVIETAVKYDVPIELRGSKLAHAYYQIQKAGVSVVASSERRRERKRGVQSFRKLVRNEIPEKIAKAGELTRLAKISKPESRAALLTKLIEEAVELKEAGTPVEVEAELADLLEVVKSLAHATGVDWEDVKQAADIKRQKRGGFEEGVVLLETSWPKSEEEEPAKPNYISLKDLSSIKVKNGKAEISFTNLFAADSERIIDFGQGLEVKIELSNNGLIVHVLARPEDMSQMEFDIE